MALKTQGTQLYAIDPASDGDLIIVGCVTSISGLSFTRDQIEITCLEATARTYEPGMVNPGTAQFGINFDPTDATHVRLHELFTANTTLKWAVGLADGTSAPTIDSLEDFVLPTSRTWITFDAYISDFPFEFALNDVVKSTLSLQISGNAVVTVKV